MSSEELKPCPFCGGEAKEDWGGTAEFYGHEHQTVTIECASCGVSLSIDTSCGKDGLASRGYEFACSCCNDTGAVARKRWNTRARLAAIQGGMGEVIEPCADLNHHERYRAGWNACLAQHQRITAAMAAEVADAKSARDAYGQNALDMQAQRDALAAELQAARGLLERITTACNLEAYGSSLHDARAFLATHRQANHND